MKYKIEYIQNQYFAYMRRIGAYGDENYKLMSNFKAWADKNELLGKESVIYGFARSDVRFTNPENCCYDIGMPISEGFTNADIKTAIFILDGKYLTFEIEHTVDSVKDFWENVFIILDKEGYKFDESKIILERYPVAMIDRGLCEICVPVL